MGYYNSPMHRLNRERKRFTSEERTERKYARIKKKRSLQSGGSSPFGGILKFLDSLKRRNKDSQGGTDQEANNSGKTHQGPRQKKG